MHYILLLIIQLFFNPIIDLEKTAMSNHGDIVVNVRDIEEIKGELLVGIYDSKRTFRKVKKVYKYVSKKVESNEEVVILEDIPAGTYAVVIFQDFNGNKKFDYNFFGIPKEPFGFSTNFKVTRRAPKYKEVTFEHDSSRTEISIEIQNW